MRFQTGASSGARRTLFGTSLGNVIVILDVTVVNVAVESIGTSLHASVAELQWVVSAYTLVFAALLLSGGASCDRYGARRTFVAGLALFTLASAGCGLAGSVAALVAARAVQGIGAATCVPASLALLTEAFPDRDERAKAISVWGGIGGLSLAAGPVVGGALIACAGWPSVFLLNIPVGLAAIWFTRRSSAVENRTAHRRLDVPGQVAVVPVLAGATYACIQGGASGWHSTPVVAGFACSALALPVLLIVERASPHPMLPLGLFRSATLNASFFSGFAMNFSYYGFLFALSLFFQSERGYSPLVTGMTFLPMTMLAVVVNFGAGSVIARVGPKALLMAGLLLAAAGYLWLTPMSAGTPYIWLVGPMLAVGIGSALCLPAFTVIVMGGVGPESRGIASGMLNASRQAGGVLGVGIFGSLVTGSSFTAGLHAALLVSVTLVLAAASAAALFVPSRKRGEFEAAASEDVAVVEWPEA